MWRVRQTTCLTGHFLSQFWVGMKSTNKDITNWSCFFIRFPFTLLISFLWTEYCSPPESEVPMDLRLYISPSNVQWASIRCCSLSKAGWASEALLHWNWVPPTPWADAGRSWASTAPLTAVGLHLWKTSENLALTLLLSENVAVFWLDGNLRNLKSEVQVSSQRAISGKSTKAIVNQIQPIPTVCWFSKLPWIWVFGCFFLIALVLYIFNFVGFFQ